MAARNKRTLTTEEQLAAALVPETELPYEIPENWCWAKAGTICSFVGGGTPSKENPNYWHGSIPWASVKDIKGDYLEDTLDRITDSGLANSAASICESDQVILVTRINPGDSIVSRIRCAINQDLKIVKSAIDPQYLHLCFENLKGLLAAKASGTTVKGVKLNAVKALPMPLAPASEQKRIVNKVHKLFSKLDEAAAEIQELIDASEERQSSILHNAFNGNLTAQWRQRHKSYIGSAIADIAAYAKGWKTKDQKYLAEQQTKCVDHSLDGHIWTECTVGAVGKVANGSTPSRKAPAYWGGDIPWVSSGEVKNNIITETNECITSEGYNGTSVNLLPAGTVLIAMIGEGKTRCQSAILDIPATINQNVAAVVIDHGYVDSRFLWYWFKYSYKRNREAGSGTGPQALNCQRVRELPFILPEKDEQIEIVRFLDIMLEREQQMQSLAVEALAAIDRARQSILSKALRGELGTNDPDEPSPKELLASIVSENAGRR